MTGISLGQMGDRNRTAFYSFRFCSRDLMSRSSEAQSLNEKGSIPIFPRVSSVHLKASILYLLC